jgi:hypothetical protein
MARAFIIFPFRDRASSRSTRQRRALVGTLKDKPEMALHAAERERHIPSSWRHPAMWVVRLHPARHRRSIRP